MVLWIELSAIYVIKEKPSKFLPSAKKPILDNFVQNVLVFEAADSFWIVLYCVYEYISLSVPPSRPPVPVCECGEHIVFDAFKSCQNLFSFQKYEKKQQVGLYLWMYGQELCRRR